MNANKLRPVLIGLAVCVAVSGCVTTSGAGNGVANSGTAANSDDCNAGLMTLGGAVVGGLLAKGSNRVRGAALGAGLAGLACMAWNYQAKQTRTAQQVQQDYRQANRGRMPERAQVVFYESRITPAAQVRPGGQVMLNSDITVVGGAHDAVLPVVEEEMTLIRPDGKRVVSRKVVNEGQGAGGYQSSFTLSMPKGVPDGEYPIKTALYLDGKQIDTRDLSLQVVMRDQGGDHRMVVAVR